MRDRISRISVFWYLGAFALVALATVLIAGLASDPAEPAAANVGDVTQVLWGDGNCDGVVDVKDLLTTEQAILGIPQDSNECGQDLQVGTRIVAAPSQASLQIAGITLGALRYQGFFGDTDCNGQVQALDALANLKWFADLPVSQVVGCAPITFAMDVTEIQIGDITPPGPITQVAIDTETNGNGANSVGAIQDCLAPSNGGTFNVDIVAKGIPPFANYAGGLGGFDFVLVYDPSQLVVTGISDQMMLAVGANNIVDYSENPPDTDGHFHVRAYDLSNNPESGNGVLARITLNAIGSGQSSLSVIAPPPARDGVPQIVDNENWIYSIQSVDDALIRIDSACGTPTPTPSPTPIPTPTSTPGVGSNQCPSGAPIDIPDNDAIGVSDTKTLADAGTISSMALCLNVSMPWAGDLYATLTHVQTGTTRILVDRLGNHAGTCSGNGNGIYVYLTDDPNPAQSMEDACSNSQDIKGQFFPDQPFVNGAGTFDGEPIAGDWKLTVSDNNTDGFTATIDGWQLYFNQ